MGLSDDLKSVSAEIWAAELRHPFVRGIGDGSLSEERFRFYLAQDYLFLIDYAKVFALAAAKSSRLELMACFAKLCADTLNDEMALHRACCAEFGMTAATLEATPAAQTTRGYTGHLLQVAATGGVADIIAVVLPCQWGYNEIARHLRAAGLPAEPRYRKWIEMYSSPEFEAYGTWLRSTLDGLAPGLTAHDVTRLRQHFLFSSRWELLFWDMAWSQTSWSTPA